MKKVTFILLGLISGTAFAQSSDTEIATVKAEIVSPIELTIDGTALNFGKIASTEAGGQVTVAPGSTTATYTADDMEVAGGTISYPTFTVNAESAYQIMLPESATLTSGSEESETTMTLQGFKTNLSQDTGVTAEEFAVGATLVVGGGQAAGEYSGTVNIKVSYE